MNKSFVKSIFLLYSYIQLISSTISPCARWNTNGIIVAGTNTHGSSSDQLDGPVGIFVYNQLNRLYVADFNNARIQMFSLNNESKQGITIASNVEFPSNIYVDDDGNREPTVYAALFKSNRVDKWIDGSKESIQVGDECRSCSGIAVDKDKNVYMTETGRHRILKWSRTTGNVTVVAGQTDQFGTLNNQLHTPQGIYIDRNQQTLYIADSKNNRIQKWLKDAQNGQTIAGSTMGIPGNNTVSLSDPIKMIFDEQTNILYVADFNNKRILRWLPNLIEGEIIAEGSEFSTNPNRFYDPTDIAFDNQGNLFVCDYFNNRIMMFAIDNQPCHSTSTEKSISNQNKMNIILFIYSIFLWIFYEKI